VIVTVTPNPSVDRTYRLGSLRPGTLNRARSVTVEASGKGVNVSRILARLGTRTRMVVTAGGPEGRLLASLLDGLPVDAAVELVEVAGHTRVNVTLITDGMEPTKVNEPGTALSAGESGAIVSAVESVLAYGGVTWLACCGSLPAGTDPGLIGQLVAAGRAARVPIAVDSSGAALAAAVDAGADLVKPNADELAELVGVDLAPHDAARAIQARTGGTVLASLGAAGALLVTPDGAWHATPPPVTPVNTTGAGDALLAGYLGAEGLAPPARLTYAVSVGASACLIESTADLPDPLLPVSNVDIRALTSLGA
jgi:1-phosphofructokinase